MLQKNNSQQGTIIEPGDKFDLIFFIIIFFVVLFLLRSNFSINNSSIFPGSSNCSQYENDFNGCVKAQRSGNRCAWYASCQKCAKEGTTLEKVCK